MQSDSTYAVGLEALPHLPKNGLLLLPLLKLFYGPSFQPILNISWVPAVLIKTKAITFML
jgi:hypothetical protein